MRIRRGAGPAARAAAAAALLTLLLPACDRAPEPARPRGVSQVQVWTVRGLERVEERSWSGTLAPLRTLAVQAPGAGRVESVAVAVGDQVSEGDVLLEFFGPELRARQEVLGLRLELLRADLEQWESLAAADAASPGEVRAAALRVLEVRELLDELDAALEAYRVRSPATGRVVESAVGPASRVVAGELLLRVDDAASTGVRLILPAREAGLLAERERLTLTDQRGAVLPLGALTFSPAPRQGYVTVDVHAEAAASPREVTLTHAAPSRGLVVPWTAVAGDPGSYWVAVVRGEPATIERRPVTLGRAHAAGVEVLEGLSEGEEVVRYQPRAYAEGRAVEPRRDDA